MDPFGDIWDDRPRRRRRWMGAPMVLLAFAAGWIGAQAASGRIGQDGIDAADAARAHSRASELAATPLAQAATDVMETAQDPVPALAMQAFNQRYRTRDGASIAYDVRWPSAAPSLPTVVLLHGGGWWTGDKRDPGIVAVAMTLQRAGFVVVSANYRLACGTDASPRSFQRYRYEFDSPLCGATIPTQVADVVDLVDHLQLDAARLRVDPRRVALMGMSAGGHLALLAGAEPGRRAPVRAVLNWSGAPSVDFIERQPITATRRGERYIRPSFTNAVGCPRERCPLRWLRASPIDAITRHRPRLAVLSLAGEAETQVPLSELSSFHEQLDRLGLDNALLAGTGLCHGGGCAPIMLSGGTTTSLDASIDFLQRILAAPPAPAG